MEELRRILFFVDEWEEGEHLARLHLESSQELSGTCIAALHEVTDRGSPEVGTTVSSPSLILRSWLTTLP